MSFFDDLRRQVLGTLGNHPEAAEAALKPGVFDGVMEMLSARGLGDVVQQFKEKGLGDVVTSWVGRGANLPISAEQVRAALGPDSLEALAQKVGLPPGQASAVLAHILPGLVDKLTPEGHVADPAGPNADTTGHVKHDIEPTEA